MKLITRNTDYAIRAISLIAQQKGVVISAAQLVRQSRIPHPFLRKILQILDKKGIVKSYKGKGGGFVLMRMPHRIYLIDLVETFQGPLQLNECLFKKMACPNKKTCALKKKLDEIEGNVIKELGSVTMASLIDKGS